MTTTINQSQVFIRMYELIEAKQSALECEHPTIFLSNDELYLLSDQYNEAIENEYVINELIAEYQADIDMLKQESY